MKGRLVRVLSTNLKCYCNAVLAVQHCDGSEAVVIARSQQGDTFRYEDSLYVPYSVWDSVAIDTPVWVSSDKVKWTRRHFAGMLAGKPTTWVAGRTSHSAANSADRITEKFIQLENPNGN
jgi:hypothetical protein